MSVPASSASSRCVIIGESCRSSLRSSSIVAALSLCFCLALLMMLSSFIGYTLLAQTLDHHGLKIFRIERFSFVELKTFDTNKKNPCFVSESLIDHIFD